MYLYIYIYLCIFDVYICVFCRRMFRSETSDSTDSWKSRGGKSQRGEEENK